MPADVLIMISILNYNFYAEMAAKLWNIDTPTINAHKNDVLQIEHKNGNSDIYSDTQIHQK